MKATWWTKEETFGLNSAPKATNADSFPSSQGHLCQDGSEGDGRRKTNVFKVHWLLIS